MYHPIWPPMGKNNIEDIIRGLGTCLSLNILNTCAKTPWLFTKCTIFRLQPVLQLIITLLAPICRPKSLLTLRIKMVWRRQTSCSHIIQYSVDFLRIFGRALAYILIKSVWSSIIIYKYIVTMPTNSWDVQRILINLHFSKNLFLIWKLNSRYGSHLLYHW